MTDDTEDLYDRIEELESRVAKLEGLAERGNLRDETPEMREYVESADPSSHVERSVVIGHFLERYAGEDSFNTNDISAGYETCRVPTASNMSDVLRRAEKQDLTIVVDSDGNQKQWRVSAEGEKYVEDLRRAEDGPKTQSSVD